MLLDEKVEVIRISDKEDLWVKRALTPRDYNEIFAIRNECTGQYAHDNAQLSKTQNETYWQKNQSNIMAWLVMLGDHPIGAISLRYDNEDRLHSFIAMRKKYRQFGRGKAAFKFLIDVAKEDVYGSVKTTNPTMLHMIATMGGWTIIDFNALTCDLSIVHRYVQQ